MISVPRRLDLAALTAILLLVGCGRSPERRLLDAAAAGDAKTVAALVKQGASVNAEDDDGWLPLAWASSSGSVGAIDALLDAGANTEVVTRRERETALTLAAKWDRGDAVKELLRRGARVDARDKISWTALMWSSLKGRTGAVQVLLDGGASVDLVDEVGNTSLMLAARQGRTDTVKLLLARGADPRARNQSGDSAASLAAAAGHADVVALLPKTR